MRQGTLRTKPIWQKDDVNVDKGIRWKELEMILDSFYAISSVNAFLQYKFSAWWKNNVKIICWTHDVVYFILYQIYRFIGLLQFCTFFENEDLHSCATTFSVA